MHLVPGLVRLNQELRVKPLRTWYQALYGKTWYVLGAVPDLQ